MIVLLSGALLLGSAPDASSGPATRPGCNGAGVTVDGSFEQAGFASCTVDENGEVVLHIRPETEPINPSPWYAARLTQPLRASRRVHLSYQGGKHRYHPWFSNDGRNWLRLTYEVAPGSEDRVSVALPAFTGSAYLSAQPLVPLATVSERWSQRVAEGAVVAIAGGTSVDGRAVPLFRAGPANAARLHVIATRQHPPETSGGAAFDAFAAHVLDLLDTSACASDAILFAPVVNPDGIARGHWRTNTGLVDLNRDWGRFAQPETRAVGAAMTDFARTATIVSVLDFHSTRDGAIYVSRASDSRAADFAAAVAQGTGLAVVETRSAAGNTLKSWSENSFGSASFTVELSDATSPTEAALIGRRIADVFADQYLCRVPGALP